MMWQIRILLLFSLLYLGSARAQPKPSSSFMAGDEAMTRGDWAAALALYQTAHRAALPNWSEAESRKTIQIAEAFYEQEQYEFCAQWLEDLLQETKLSPLYQSNAFHLRFNALQKLGDWDKITTQMLPYESLVQTHFTPQSPAYIAWLLDLSSLYLHRGESQAAIELCKSVEPWIETQVKQEGDLRLIFFNNLSKAYYQKADILKAEEYRERSIAVLEKQLGSKGNEALLKIYVGYIKDLINTQKSYKALRYLLKALPLDQQLHLKPKRLSAELQWLAFRLYWDLLDRFKAKEHLLRFLALAPYLGGFRREQVLAKGYLLGLDSQTKPQDWEQCSREQQQVLGLDSVLNYTLRRWCGAALKTEDHQQLDLALEHYAKYCQQFPNEWPYWHWLKAESHLLKGKVLAGLTEIEQGLNRCAAPPTEAQLWELQARSYQRLYNSTGDLEHLKTAYRASEQIGQLLLATEAFQYSDFQLLDPLAGKVPYPSLGLELSLRLYEQTREEYYKNAYFFWMELNQHLQWKQAIWQSATHTNKHLPDSLSNLEHVLFVEQPWSEQSAQRKAFLAHLKEQYPRYYDFRYRHELISLADFQQQLPDNLLVLHYFQQDSNLYVLKINKTSSSLLRLANPPQAWASLKAFKSSFVQADNDLAKDYGEYCQRAHLLYEWLLQDCLDPKQPQVLIIPDGDLLGLPFDALIEELPRTAEPNFEALPYLLRRYAFGYAHSATTWAQNRRYRVQRQDKHLLAMDASYAFRDPYPFNFNHENLAEFVHLQRQTALLRGFIPSISFSDQAATEAELKRWLPQSNLFHLVAYLRANPYRALSAGFLLSAYGQDEDHILQGLELALLPLHLDLAVFPAGGESVEAQALMARCLMFAGGPAVAFSFWPMDDKSSNFITEHYYQNLKYTYNKPDALRESKLAYLSRNKGLAAHPRYWAGLSQWGKAEAIKVQDIRRWWAWVMGFSLVAGLGVGVFRWWYKEHAAHTEALSYWERRRREKKQKMGRRI